MISDLRTKQYILRNDLISEVENYLGYAEDIHSDHISVNEKTLDVDFRSHHDDESKPDVKYYDVSDLIQRKGLWFKPDTKAIEAVVQTYLPSPNIKVKFDEWCDAIKSFLVTEQPSTLQSCRFSIGTCNFGLSCFDEQKNPIEEGGDLTYEDEMDDEWETVDIIPMRKAVSKTYSGYSISVYKLTKLILNYIDPICS